MTAETGTDLQLAARLIRDGGLVAFPTETVYGLGADALNPRAVARIFAAKRRPAFDPLIVHIAHRSTLARIVRSVPPAAEQLMDQFWPGPLSLVLPRTSAVPDLVTSGLDTVAVRMPALKLARDLIDAAGTPIAAPSANRFGRISPTTAAHVAEQLNEDIDYILDGGACSVGVESTVLQFVEAADTGHWQLLRPGGLPREAIEEITGPIQLVAESQHPVAQAQPSPGMLPRHYAPSSRLELIDAGASLPEASEPVGVILYRRRRVPEGYIVEVLSEDGDLEQCAATFFAALRRLDALGLNHIYAERFPDHGLGLALNDRLHRAAR